MKKSVLCSLVLLLFVSGCGERYFAWDFEYVDSTSLSGICVEVFRHKDSRKVDRSLCKNIKLNEKVAKGFESKYIHCTALPDYVWVNCDPGFIKMMFDGKQLN